MEDVNALRLQAEADAKKDANKDITEFMPFFMGIGAGFAGAMCAIMTGCTLGDMYPNVSAPVGIGAMIASSAIFIAPLWSYNNPPYPPVERFIGEHPEYIEAYINAYDKKYRSRQRIVAYTGAAVGCSIVVSWAYIQVNYGSFFGN